MAEITNAILTMIIIVFICGGSLLIAAKRFGWLNFVSGKTGAPVDTGQTENYIPTEIITNFFEEKVYLTYYGQTGEQEFEIALREGEHYLLGRSPDCDLVIPDLRLSGHEAFIGKDDKGYFFGYMGRNGAYDENLSRVEELALLAEKQNYIVYIGGGPVKIGLSFHPHQSASSESVFSRKHKQEKQPC